MEIREVDSKKNQEMLSTLLENYSQSQNKNIPVYEKKEISLGTTVKAVITGYVSYGILVGFIVFAISVFVCSTLAYVKQSLIIPALFAK